MKSKTKLVATVCLTSYQQALTLNIQRLKQADMIEWRLDYLKTATMDEIRQGVDFFHQQLNRPVLLTLRTEGRHPISSYKEALCQLASVADVLDVEWETIHHDNDLIAALSQETEVILSYHQFAGTWPNIAKKLNEMAKGPCAHLKLALNEEGMNKAVLSQLPHYIETLPQTLSVMVMGKKGAITRKQAPSLNEGFVYASMDEKPKYGQLTLEEMMPYMKGKRVNGKKEKNCEDECNSRS